LNIRKKNSGKEGSRKHRKGLAKKEFFGKGILGKEKNDFGPKKIIEKLKGIFPRGGAKGLWGRKVKTKETMGREIEVPTQEGSLLNQ